VSDLDLAATPALAAGVRLTHDRRRDRWVLQAPERVIVLDETALAVVRRLDGRPLAAVVDDLAKTYEAPPGEIAADVLVLIADLRAKGVLAGG
jgi:coenzyme PQQ biosynthesis protein PqqD